jgi:hypothetical protein
MKALLAAAAATLALGATAAHATDYQLGTLSPGQTSSQAAVYTVGAGTTTDDFYFTLAAPYETYTSAGFIQVPGVFDIDSVNLTLFDSSNTAITSTGAFDPSTTVAPTLAASLGAGTYHVEATLMVPKGKSGAYDVIVTPTSAAPEPGTWALMFAGVALAGFALRRRQGSAALA